MNAKLVQCKRFGYRNVAFLFLLMSFCHLQDFQERLRHSVNINNLHGFLLLYLEFSFATYDMNLILAA